METIKILKREKQDKQLIGFCGGPFTVLTYMLEGGTSKKHNQTKKKILQDRNDFKNLIDLVTEFSIIYLEKQIYSGVDIVKVFESWAGLLDEEDYNEFIIEPNKRIKEVKKSFQPFQSFFSLDSQQAKYIPLYTKLMNVLSLDKDINEVMETAKKNNIILQGNLDPLILYRVEKN